jgi:ACS family hexuronate transporter-like MFS transporter
VAGMLSNIALGETLDKAGSTGFFWAFLITGSLYSVALLLVHLIMPQMTPLDDNLEPIRK